MANEVTASGSIVYEDSENTEYSVPIEDFVYTVTTKRFSAGKMNVAITEEAVPLGDVTSPGYAIFVNRDATNYIDLKVASGGAIFARLRPSGGFAILFLGSGAASPYAIANTAACQMEYFIVSQ